jgi:hypothetical protein
MGDEIAEIPRFERRFLQCLSNCSRRELRIRIAGTGCLAASSQVSADVTGMNSEPGAYCPSTAPDIDTESRIQQSENLLGRNGSAGQCSAGTQQSDRTAIEPRLRTA